MRVQPGQVWEFCGGPNDGRHMIVLVIAPRPDMDSKWGTSEEWYWDVVYLACNDWPEDEGTLDWIGIQPDDEDWVRLS